ncbi:lysophospholipid acyltransferase family protein [Hyalangium gracile]|uniref:lysophospholipid acyltransferase family protein n=1 Tax=Hyalangium gracile TaxID=394092 RepID=UPI001CCE1B63|nr:lysophospholipid acyltransferase family protein [Hyalangium gracile]
MATKGVLGNDPFQRGAAQRPSDTPSTPATPLREPGETAAPAAAAKKARPASGKGGKAAKKAEPAKASGKGRSKAAESPAAEAKPSKGRKGRAAGPSTEETHRLREPAAPVTPRKRPPARVPVLGGSPEATLPRTPKEQEVDRVLATAVAIEATEAAAEVAAEVAVDTLLTLQTRQQQGAAGAPPGSLEETWNRELATAVVAEAAEAAAEAVLEAALAAGTTPAGATDEVRSFEERTAIAAAFEEEEDEDEDEDTEDVSAEPSPLVSAEVTVIDRAYSVEVSESADLDEAQAEPEQELPDTTRDELPAERQAPISLVPPLSDEEPAREPFFTDQAQREQEASAPPSEGFFSLAKEIAVQALTSASVGKALGTAHGLLDVVRASLGTSGSTSLDEYGRDAELVGGIQPLLDFLYERYWRVSVQGADQVPPGGAILVANHSGALPFDGLVASLALLRERPELREPRWLVEDQVFHAPMLGTLFNRLGAVRACPENAVRLLDEQRPVLVFPEGYQGLSKPFAQRYQLKRFGRGGFVKLALRTGAPIIPVAIVGSEETSPLLGRIPASFLGVPYVPLTSPVPLPARWTLRFGEPVAMEGLGPEAADDLAEVQRLTERTREAIQGMLQALLRERRSVFAG